MVREWVRQKEMRGGRFFTFDDVHRELPTVSIQVLKNSLMRLKKSRRITSPYRGFYVIMPPEYVLRGGVPAFYYMDDLMQRYGKKYYFSLLSAAALWGAAHQAPQVDFVTIDGPRLFTGARERRDVKWISRSVIPSEFVLTKRGEAGDVCYSNAELTAVELVQYEQYAGGLSSVATVLGELLESTDFAQSSEGVFKVCKESAIQRLGYLVERVLHDELQGEVVYHEWVSLCKSPHYVLLSPRSAREPLGRDERWKIIVNAEPEPDET